MCKPANVIFPPAYIYVKVFLRFFTECIVSGIRYSASEGPTIDSFNLVSPEKRCEPVPKHLPLVLLIIIGPSGSLGSRRYGLNKLTSIWGYILSK